MISAILQGMGMSLADSVPGISGGTIAFIFGYYEKFLGALHNLIGKEADLRKEAFFYLCKFAIGWAAGMIACVLVLTSAFESSIYFLSSLFLGFTVAAIPFIAHQERLTIRGKLCCLPFSFLGLILVVLLAMLRQTGIGIGTVNFLDLTVLQYGYLIAAGVLAISAMLLPGISGSTLLLIFGVYVPAVTALREVLHLHLEYLPGVLALATGILFGIFFAAGLIRKALRRFRAQMVYLILGLMAGSLYAIAMGPTTLESPRAPVDLSSFDVAAFLLGIAIFSGLEFIKYRIENSATKKDELIPKAENRIGRPSK